MENHFVPYFPYNQSKKMHSSTKRNEFQRVVAYIIFNRWRCEPVFFTYCDKIQNTQYVCIDRVEAYVVSQQKKEEEEEETIANHTVQCSLSSLSGCNQFLCIPEKRTNGMMLFMLLFSRQGKLRLQKWYVAHPDKVKKKITRELITTILAR